MIVPPVFGTNISGPRSPTKVGAPLCIVPPPADSPFIILPSDNTSNGPEVGPEPNTVFKILLTTANC